MAAPLIIAPIFPLPDVTFFPHTLMPLHVFEARYRVMVIDALERDRKLAVVRLQPGYEATYAGKPAVHAVGGLGEIVSCERLATGRYNILLRGECRGVRFVYLKVIQATAMARSATRVGHFAGPALVPSQFAALEEPADALTIDGARPPEEIVAAIRHAFGI